MLSASCVFWGNGYHCRSKPCKPGVKRAPANFFTPLLDFHFTGKRRSQSSMSFVWKQSLLWPRRSGCFRTDPDVQMCCSVSEVSLIHIQKWKRCLGALKQSLGSFPAPLDLMAVSYLANLASTLVFQRLLIAVPSFPWQYGKFRLCILITWPRLL